MRFVCRNFGLSDLARRGLTAQEAPLAVLLLDVEAELSVWDRGRPVWSEEAFPVAELAYHLARWVRGPAGGRGDFGLDSAQAESGLVRVVGCDGGWRVGSVLAPGVWTSPVGWDVLVAEIERFDRSVREGLAAVGVDPAFVLGP
ncbi:hypothetical protein [Kitasatospora sp. NRRL B-11411]|uniref:DUF7878 domain-containing protein n=1 Tax=Kitasatospora sp. NRRL B-11411 TaxID=1463822 RepID=UPI000A76E4C2|nr:hypothetical protein [Kitasatospora sp. NRRL B-11411]